MDLNVKLKIVNPLVAEKGWTPKYQTPFSAGMDLIACIDAPVHLRAGAAATLIPTGIAVDMMERNVAAMIYPRSGLGHKKGLVLGNGVGIIDADYQGEIFVSAWNRNAAAAAFLDPKIGWVQKEGAVITIHPGDRIAQLVFMPIARAHFEVVDEFAASGRGAGGFGSTGVAA